MKLNRLLIFSLPLFVVFAVQARLGLRQPGDQTQIAVGMAAPDFTLEDEKGQKVNLAALVKKQPVVLIFYRGYW